MQKLGVFFILTLAWATIAQASPFSISEKISPKFEKELLHAYRFVTARIPDPIDRHICPIKLSFKNLKNSFGKTIAKRDQKHCDDEIIIDKSLKENWRAQSVFVHELTHLFRYAHNPDETLWLDEGTAKVMEALYIGIWQTEWEEQFKKSNLLKLSNSQKDYTVDGQGHVDAYFLMQYLFDHLGEMDFLSEVVRSPSAGWENIELAAKRMRAQNRINIPEEHLSAPSLWLHFGFAAILNDPFRVLYKLFLIGGRYNGPDLKQFSKMKAPELSSEPWQISYWYLANESSIQDISEKMNDSKDQWYAVEVNSGWKERLIQEVDFARLGGISIQRYPLLLIQVRSAH